MFKILGKIVCVLLLLSQLPCQNAHALTELNAVVRDQYVLKTTPNFEGNQTEYEVAKGESTFVLGTSIDGAWVRVLRKDGKSGWMPVHLLDLHRVDQEDYDDFYFALMRERRKMTRWSWEAGLSFGTTPFGVGAETMLRLNLFKEGAVTHKTDQLEIGTGLRYHLGAAPSPTFNGVSLVSASAQKFWEIPLELSWMFRLGYRGSLMVGPHFGVSFVKDPYARFNPAMPAVAGINFRYFPRDNFGIYLHSWVHLRSVIYFSASTGVTWRF